LRDRVEDIPLLIEYFFDRFVRTKKTKITGLKPEAIEALKAYHWPGNIRELENLVERLVVLSDGPTISAADLPALFTQTATKAATAVSLEEGFNLKEHLLRVETDFIRQALARTGSNQAQAARLLGMNRTTLVEKLKKLERLEKKALT
ncbi:MAG: sigma-54-dependent Fis family transcriptional regulator, partial [Deltaproteobacteria bacterium]|nr:sigma-54-dependent Fis family transcriptional regulator [Deltaproteobacteria bacterium]